MKEIPSLDALHAIFGADLSKEAIKTYLTQQELTPLDALAIGFPGGGGHHTHDLTMWLQTVNARDDADEALAEMIVDGLTIQNDYPFKAIARRSGVAPADRDRALYYAALHGSPFCAREWHEGRGRSNNPLEAAFAIGLLQHGNDERRYEPGVEIAILRQGMRHLQRKADFQRVSAQKTIRSIMSYIAPSGPKLPAHADIIADRIVETRSAIALAEEDAAAAAVTVADPMDATDHELSIALAILAANEDRHIPDGEHMRSVAWRRGICVAAWEYGGHDCLSRFRPGEPDPDPTDGETLDILVDEIRIEDDGSVTAMPPAIEKHTIRGEEVVTERFVFPEPQRLGHRVLDTIDLTAAKARDALGFMSTYEPIAGKDLFWSLPARLVADVRREIASAYPHATEIVDALLDRCADGKPIAFRPTLLVGAPGSGKTSILRAITAALGVPSVVYPCASVSDGSFGGTPSQWSTRRASTPLEAVRTSGSPNPVVLLDEIEKSGSSSAGALTNALLPFLETHTASSYFEVGLERTADLSAVSYLATANSLDGVSPALRDRFRILQMPDPQPEHIAAIASRIVADLRTERRLHVAFMPDLEPDEIEVIAKAWSGGSLRRLHRAVGATLDARERLMRGAPQ